MRTIPIAVAALALLGAAASAQTSQTSPSHSTATLPGTTTAPAPAARAPAINPLNQADISNIEGTTVYGGDDAKAGRVSNVLMDPSNEKIDQLVVAAGGLLGIGSHRVAIPVDQFSWDSARAPSRSRRPKPA